MSIPANWTLPHGLLPSGRHIVKLFTTSDVFAVVVVSVADYVFFENSSSNPYLIRRIEELNKVRKRGGGGMQISCMADCCLCVCVCQLGVVVVGGTPSLYAYTY